MSSAKQVAANRLNAAKSTGPRTESGKARSSRNALKHGLSAEQVVMFRAAEHSLTSLVRIAGAIEGSMYRASRELERMNAGRQDPVNDDFVIDAEVDEEDWPE